MKAPAAAVLGGADAKAKQQTTDAYYIAKPSRPQDPAQKQPPPSPAPTVDLAVIAEGAL